MNKVVLSCVAHKGLFFVYIRYSLKYSVNSSCVFRVLLHISALDDLVSLIVLIQQDATQIFPRCPIYTSSVALDIYHYFNLSLKMGANLQTMIKTRILLIFFHWFIFLWVRFVKISIALNNGLMPNRDKTLSKSMMVKFSFTWKWHKEAMT